MCKVLERRVVEHTAVRQVAREQRELFAYPVDQLFNRVDAIARDQPIVIDQAEAGLAVERYGPEPEALSTEVVRGLPCRSMSERGAVGPRANLPRRKICQLLDVEQPLDPEEVSSMANLAFGRKAQTASQKPAAARRVNDPCRVSGHFAFDGLEREQVRTTGFRQLYVKIHTAGMKIEVRILEIDAEHLAFELVAVELIGINVRELPDVRLAVVLIAIVRLPWRFPIEAQVVFQVVLLQKMFFKIDDAQSRADLIAYLRQQK